MKEVAIIEKNMGRRHRRLAKMARAATGQVLIVVPEIWLLGKVTAAFPANSSMAIFYAGLPQKQQTEIWQRVQENKVNIIIGTQKALFLPYHHLAMIIIEEEYFPTHKLWDQYPRLSNIDAATALAEVWQANLVWSGSFASLRLHQAISQEKVDLVVSEPTKPRVNIIRTTYEDRQRGWLLPQQFIQELRAARRKQEQVIMLRNRKGATGPAKIKALLGQLFGRRTGFIVDTAALFTRLQDSKVDKVVWLFPEDSLSYPDFRSAERAWYTLVRLQQLVGPKGVVTLVSRGQHVARVEEILGQSPEQFYQQQLAERARFGYPPFNDMVRLTVSAKTVAAAQRRAEEIRQTIEKNIAADEVISLRGPFASFEKTTHPQRHLLLTGPLPRLTSLYAGLPLDRVDVSPERIV